MARSDSGGARSGPDHIRLRARTQPEAKAIQFRFRSLCGMIRRRQAEIDPEHPMLGGKEGELNQRCQLVAGTRTRVGEAGCDLVFPS